MTNGTRLSIILVLTTALVLTHSVQLASERTHQERRRVWYLLGATNVYRDSLSLPSPLRMRDTDLRACAQHHAQAMARKGSIYHSDCPASEIVGMGPSVHSVFRAWQKSPGHDEIMRTRRYRVVEFGVVRDRSTWYLVALFR